MQEQKKRLFIALNLPQNIKDEISDLINKLAKQNSKTLIKWVKPKSMHLTLHFLGYLSEEKIGQVKLAMQSFQGKFGRLQFRFGKINTFPNLTSPRVIFIECNQVNSKSIFKLQELLGEKLIQLGIRVDKRPWKPHLTLGRVKVEKKLQIPLDLSLPSPLATAFIINSFDLIESKLKPAGSKYSKIINCTT